MVGRLDPNTLPGTLLRVTKRSTTSLHPDGDITENEPLNYVDYPEQVIFVRFCYGDPIAGAPHNRAWCITQFGLVTISTMRLEPVMKTSDD